MDELIGRKAYKKRGFYGGLVGIIERSTSNITPYRIVFGNGGSVGIRDERDIEIVDQNYAGRG